MAPSPVPIDTPCEVESVYCGRLFRLLRATDGTLWSAGINLDGQLGLSDLRLRRKFTQIPHLVSTQVACGYWHCLSIDDQSRLWGWGCCGYRQLRPYKSSLSRPTILRTDAKLVLAGETHTLVVTRDDEVLGCGLNSSGELAAVPTYTKNHWISTSITADMIGPIWRAPQPLMAKSARSTIRL